MTSVAVEKVEDLLAELESIGNDREKRLLFVAKHRKSPAIVGGWKHHDGHTYWASSLAFDTRDGSVLVVYARTEVTSAAVAAGAAFARPLTEWTAIAGSGQPRFIRAT